MSEIDFRAVDYLGCEFMSRDIPQIEGIARNGSKGPTGVTYLYLAQPAPLAPVASIVPPHCSGIVFVFEPGVLRVNKDGSGYIAIAEDDFVLEDDRCEGPEGPEGSVHWIARLDAGDITALRDFLNGTAAPAPHATGDDKPLDETATHPEWLWYCESTDGVPVISFGRWPKHPQQRRYKYAEIQETEHDHPAQCRGE